MWAGAAGADGPGAPRAGASAGIRDGPARTSGGPGTTSSWPFVAKGETGSGQYVVLLPRWGAFKCPWGRAPSKPPAAGTVPPGSGGEHCVGSGVGLTLWPGREPRDRAAHPSPSRSHQFPGFSSLPRGACLHRPPVPPSRCSLVLPQGRPRGWPWAMTRPLLPPMLGCTQGSTAPDTRSMGTLVPRY